MQTMFWRENNCQCSIAFLCEKLKFLFSDTILLAGKAQFSKFFFSDKKKGFFKQLRTSTKYVATNYVVRYEKARSNTTIFVMQLEKLLFLIMNQRRTYKFNECKKKWYKNDGGKVTENPLFCRLRLYN